MANDLSTADVAAQRAFAEKFDGLLRTLFGFSQLLGESVGSITADAAWRTLRQMALELFDQGLPLRSAADPELLRLVRAALEILSDDDCKLDRLEWRKAARKVLQGADPPREDA